MTRTLVALLLILCFLSFSYAQEHNISEFENKEPRHRAAFILGHSFISLDNKEILAIPTFGLDYEYWISDKWGIGIFSDLELISKEVSPTVNDVNIEREYPLVVTLDVLWSPIKHWEFVIGPGFISEKGETEPLVRIGAERDLELGHHWDVPITLFYDKKFDGNYAISIGIGIAKRF
ncbi:hypothetical protein ACPX19_01665 [Winogradskyella sp. HB-48]|uniref:hypothetical protein n=1 Tax=Winogradskyella sp. HB-48 TaxID=3416808 RepID=UPI003CED3D7C